jgi:hypothetical protein
LKSARTRFAREHGLPVTSKLDVIGASNAREETVATCLE